MPDLSTCTKVHCVLSKYSQIHVDTGARKDYPSKGTHDNPDIATE